MIVEFDSSKFQSLRAKDKNGDWWKVTGKCLRCGNCGCIESRCIHFTHETVDGKKLGKCMRQFEKPFMCAIFPFDPDTPLPETCGFKWEKE